jgi:acetoin utilization deacetylase AcuC-like enzyme
MKKNTAIVYHEDYLKHAQFGSHPERMERLAETLSLLKDKGIFNSADLLMPEPATEEDLLRVHSRNYVDYVKNLSFAGGGMITPDTAVHSDTYEIAKLAAGGVMLAGESVVRQKYKNSYALVRPPGHHATRNAGMGFCYFNNVAVMIEYLKDKHNLKKILILDWDAHAANGTMDIFYNDNSVLNISIHQDPHNFYPGTGFIYQIGEGKGEGYTVNIPVQEYTSDADYVYILENFVIPVAEGFKPELIVISSGLDSHKDDFMSDLCLTEQGYGVMTNMIKELAEKFCGGKLVVELEGGYNLKSLAQSNLEIVNSLIGISNARIAGQPKTETIELVNRLKDKFSGYHKI